MNEKLEKELDNWFNEYKLKEKELLNKHPLKDDTLYTNHPINKLQKKYWEKKKEILKKYNDSNSTQ